ncbi:MAG: DNA-binding protein [Sphingobacteriales bacterium]|nr:MAG: DNA-binding protein [Sphingobacteriales bacterium]
MIITFDELRKVKDSLPHGSLEKIADEVGTDVQTVRNYFGSQHFDHGGFTGAHYELGPTGTYVDLQDTQIYETAMKLIKS